MNCDQARQHWHLYHDSEGDAELHLQINKHLDECSECSRWFIHQSAIEEAIVHSLRADTAPTKELWDRLESRLAPAAPSKSRRWSLFSLVSFSMVATLLLAFGLGGWVQSTPDLTTLSAALHDRLASGREAPRFVSTSHLEIENYLKSHVPFPVRCPPREDAGFLARGGGTCQLADAPVAYVVGEVEGQEVSLLILSRKSLSQHPKYRDLLLEQRSHYARIGQLDVVMTEFDQNVVLAIGKARREELQRLLNAYGSYAHGDSHLHSS